MQLTFRGIQPEAEALLGAYRKAMAIKQALVQSGLLPRRRYPYGRQAIPSQDDSWKRELAREELNLKKKAQEAAESVRNRELDLAYQRMMEENRRAEEALSLQKSRFEEEKRARAEALAFDREKFTFQKEAWQKDYELRLQQLEETIRSNREMSGRLSSILESIEEREKRWEEERRQKKEEEKEEGSSKSDKEKSNKEKSDKEKKQASSDTVYAYGGEEEDYEFV